MMTKALKGRIEIRQGEIIHQEVDAIVNAANESLLAVGGLGKKPFKPKYPK